LLTGGAFAAALMVVVWFFMMGWGQQTEGTDAGPIESLAVLPLQNLSGDPEEEYFADGMTEALITNLSKIGSLKVISRTSAMRYKGTDKPLPEIASELGVDAIVEGSVLRAGDRVRISAQLVDVATDQHLWAESYERDMGDVLELQGEVARAVAAGIQITLTPEEQASLGTMPAVDPTRTEEGIQKSLDYFQQAVAQDPDYASAHSGLADAYTIGMEYGYLPAGENRSRSRTAALRAVELDDSLPEAHASLAMVFASEREWLAGEREFRRALELNPNYTKARHWYSIHLAAMGRLEEALAEMERAVALDPASLQAEVWLGTCLLYLRRYDEAIGQFEETIEKDPYYFNSHYWLGQAYEAKGLAEEAVAAYEKAASLSETPHQRATLAHGYAVAGRRAEALTILGELEGLAEQKYVSPYDFAVVQLGLGDNDRAIELLEQVYEDYPENLRHIKVRPWFDPLRDDPRFQSLLQRMNFPE
jgi:TolB-like protein/tetratricopeptide (TPR) repeat protein